MSDDFDLFGEDDLAIPTVRGSANLDAQDYARGPSGEGSSILDDELQEDIPSRPGDGAGPAFDIDGAAAAGPFMEDDDAPGMEQTTYGAQPWGPGGSEGYRPASMMRTGADLSGGDDMREPKPPHRDSMMMEPEVVQADRAMARVVNTERGVPVQAPRWSGNRNQMPSNRYVDPETIYDRSSYEYDDSSQDTIGSGIFGMEEGVTWRPRDGIFAHQFAMPGYIANEDELGVQQSEMWDTTANNWRVTQVSASGVPLKKRVSALRPAYSPFVDGGVPEMRPEATGPRSHIEAFGRKTAAALIEEARVHTPATRSRFIASALEAMGPGTALRANTIAQRLVQMGYPPEAALEDVVAHCVMHAAMRDLTQSAGRRLPRLDRLASAVSRARPKMQQAAAKHVAPMTQNKNALRADLGALMASPAGRGMGQVAPESTTLAPVPTGLLTPRNLLIAGVLGVGGYLAWTNRRALQRNAKKIGRDARKLARRVGLR